MSTPDYNPLEGYPGKLKAEQRAWLERLLRIHRGAGYDEGFQDGHTEGYEQGREDARLRGEVWED